MYDSYAASAYQSALVSDMIQSNYSEPNCKLQVMQKDLRIVVNMSDSFDQPLHVGAAVNEVRFNRRQYERVTSSCRHVLIVQTSSCSGQVFACNGVTCIMLIVGRLESHSRIRKQSFMSCEYRQFKIVHE